MKQLTQSINTVLDEFKEWRSKYDEGYCYDQIHDFVNDIRRGDLLEFFDSLIEKAKEEK